MILARSTLFCAALLPSLAVAEAAPPPLQTLQLIEMPTPEGQQKASPGTIIARAAIARLDAAILASDVTLGGKRLLARGTVLRADVDSDDAKATIKVFCEPPRAVPVEKPASAAAKSDTRYCLFDADSDGKFDHAFPYGAKGKAVVVAATDFGRIDGRPLGSNSVAQLRYLGAVPGTDSVAVELAAYLDGWKRTLPHPRTVISVARLPAYGVVGSGVVTVLAYDKQTQIATIRMDHGLAPGHIAVPELIRGY